MPVSRRDFLNTSGLASAAALTTPLWAYAKVAAFEFEEATLAGLQEKMKTGALTARALTRAYLDRIESMDRSGPRLRSLLETNPEALAVADSLDRERKAK